MHPDPAFELDAGACRAFAADVAFAHLFVARDDRPVMIHAPVVLEDDRLIFHVARRNRALPLPEGTRAIASFGGPGVYVSPDWYDSAEQVPTWNYIAVEAEGPVAPIDDDALVAHLDALSHAHEARLTPKPEWTRAKMEPRRFDAMRSAILGFSLRVESWRGTAKLSQNKGAADVRGVIAGLRASGKSPEAGLIEAANPAKL